MGAYGDPDKMIVARKFEKIPGLLEEYIPSRRFLGRCYFD